MAQLTSALPLPQPFIFREVAIEPLESSSAAASSAMLCGPTSLELDTTPLHGDTQEVEAFGLGYYGPEWKLSDEGAHWTNGRGHAYFIPRLAASELWIDYRSPFPDDTRFELLLGRLEDALTQTFIQEMHVEFRGTRNRLTRLVLPLELAHSGLYCLTLLSPTVPSARLNLALGLGVVSIKLMGRPFDAPPVVLPAKVPAGNQAGQTPKAVPGADSRTRGIEMFAAGRYEEACALFHEVLNREGGAADLWNDWAAAAMLAGNPRHAEQGFRLAIAMSEQNHEPVTNLAVLLARQQRVPEAVALLERWLPGFPEDRKEAGRQLLEACRGNRNQ